MDPDGFNEKTQAFLAWLPSIGVKTSPKMALVDMRGENCARRVGTSFAFTKPLYLVSLWHILHSMYH